MNLIKDKWITVINKDSAVQTVSIEDIFTNCKDITDISGSWSDKVTIYNLLFGISQSALRGSLIGEDDFYRLFSEGYTKEIITYLNQDSILKAFDFYSKDFFYNNDFIALKDKEEENEEGEEDSSTKDWAFFSQGIYPSGNNHLFYYRSSCKKISTISKILNLLKYHLFYIGHGNNKSLKSKWGEDNFVYDKIEKDQKFGFTAYSKNNLYTYIQGINLYETIFFNLFLIEDLMQRNIEVGLPIWEQKISNPNDVDAIRNAQSTFLGLKVPCFFLLSYEESNDNTYYLLLKNLYYQYELEHQHFIHKTFIPIKDDGGSLRWRSLEIKEEYPLVKYFPSVLQTYQEENDESSSGMYNTPLLSNIRYLSNKSIFQNEIKIVSGVWIGKIQTSIITRYYNRSCESPMIVRDSVDFIPMIGTRYSGCMDKITENGILRKNLLKIKNKFNDPFSSEPKSILKDHPSFKMIESIAYRFLFELDNHHLDILDICKKNMRPCLSAEEKDECKKLFKTVFSTIVDDLIPTRDSTGIARRCLIKNRFNYILKSEIFSDSTER